MQSRLSVLLSLLSLAVVAASACSDSREFSQSEAKKIADRRYVDYAKSLGVPQSPVPTPAVDVRLRDYVFVYQQGRAKVTVIVERTGEVADTYELRGN